MGTLTGDGKTAVKQVISLILSQIPSKCHGVGVYLRVKIGEKNMFPVGTGPPIRFIWLRTCPGHHTDATGVSDEA